MGRWCVCSPKLFFALLVVSAIPIGYLIHLETCVRESHVYEYRSPGWMRECSKWDHQNNRFIVSFFDGGMGVVPMAASLDLEEIAVVKEADLAGNASLGFSIDRPRNRVLVAIADVFGNRYSALAAYDLTTWNRLFLTRLAGPEDDKAFADDVAVDKDGNAYVTDTRGSKIWKVGVNGEVVKLITSPLFTPQEWYKQMVQLNGIVYHPNGYLLVIHTFSGNLYKIQISGDHEKIKLVKVAQGSLRFGDGMEVLSPTQLIVASNPSKLVESTDNWETAKVVGVAKGATHRLVTAATVKDGKPYLNHMFGLGYPKRKHVLIEAVFK